MKKIFSIIAAALAAFSLNAQQVPELPIDTEVREGKLDNGMTYYIRHNANPEQRAEFYLATHVGAAQEAPDQDGLAHFLEHMCFNGTKNFPGKALLDYLQGIGASFGGNVNASTGLESTKYMLNNIPLLREGVLDTCLLIMHDYSHFVTCDPAEIDAERGVIIEEKRSRNNASWRSFMEEKKVLFKGCVLESTSLIGSQENLENFKPESLVNFYRTWYRPDLQALVVVGDVDVDQVEAKIKTIFSDIPAAVNPQAKTPVIPADNEEPLTAVITDKESTSTGVELVWKSLRMPREYRNTEIGFMTEIIKAIYEGAMNERLNDIASKPGADFISAGFGFTNLCDATDDVYGSAEAREGESFRAMKAFYTEIERMKRYGFTDAEYKRAKDNLLNDLEEEAARAETRKNAEFIRPIINHFFDNETLLSPAEELKLAKKYLPLLGTKELNEQLAQVIPANNMVAIISGPAKEGLSYPTEAEMKAAIEEIAASDIAAPAAEKSQKALIKPSAIRDGKIVAEKEGAYGSTEWTLSNGVKVILKPSALEKNKVSINLLMKGGKSLIETSELPSVSSSVFRAWQSNAGVGKLSGTDLPKVLAGKSVSVNTGISDLYHNISASTTTKDIETAMQLVYLSFTSPRFDKDEFETARAQVREQVTGLVNNPRYKFSQEFYKTAYGDNPRQRVIDLETVESANIKSLEKSYRKLFSSADGAILQISGDFDIETVRPLVLKYAASLRKGKATTWSDRHVDMVDGEYVNHFTNKMEAPCVTVALAYKVKHDFTVEYDDNCEALAYILDMIYVDTMREEEGGTYGASAYAETDIEPVAGATLQVMFQTNVEMADKLTILARKGLAKVAEEGPTAEQFERTRNNMLKNIPERRARISYWSSVLNQMSRFGYDYDAEHEASVNGLTPERIQKTAREFLESGNCIEVRMSPEE